MDGPSGHEGTLVTAWLGTSRANGARSSQRHSDCLTRDATKPAPPRPREGRKAGAGSAPQYLVSRHPAVVDGPLVGTGPWRIGSVAGSRRGGKPAGSPRPRWQQSWESSSRRCPTGSRTEPSRTSHACPLSSGSTACHPERLQRLSSLNRNPRTTIRSFRSSAGPGRTSPTRTVSTWSTWPSDSGGVRRTLSAAPMDRLRLGATA